MKILNKNAMQNLSFPDSEIEQIEFSPENKQLNIYVDGAYLNQKGGIQLGKGVLYFSDWENFSINRFDPIEEKWLSVNLSRFEPLTDIPEVKFSDTTVSLYGFGGEKKQWMELKIQKANMYAEFES